MADDLKLSEVAILIALMAEAEEVSNVDLKQRYGITLTGDAKRRLNERKLVTSRKVGRAFAHELTDLGWARCREELSAPCPPRAGTAGGALYALLNGLHRYAGRTGLNLASIFGRADPEAEPTAVEAAVRAAYARTPQLAGGGVSLAQLRPLLSDLPRHAVDDALVRMGRQPRVSLLPNENRKGLTEADRAAAVQIGPTAYHYLLIEGA
jgi:hypothetical protein